jgi:hypothetical protein
MPEARLVVVDGLSLPGDYREVLRPGEVLLDEAGREHRLPRWFLRVESWQDALNIRLTEHFHLWEFIGVDVREAPLLRSFPRYVPCAVFTLASALEVVRQAVGTYVHIAANGGYRSPGHGLSRHASRHCWGSAVNIYRIGDDYLDSRSVLENYGRTVKQAVPGVWLRPYGSEPGRADDHLHVDLGYVTTEPVAADGAGATSEQ